MIDADGVIRNVAQGDAKLAQALIRDKRIDTLHLLAASQTRDKDALTDEGVERVIGELRERFDYVLCDSPAGIERGALLAMHWAPKDLFLLAAIPPFIAALAGFGLRLAGVRGPAEAK